MKTTLLLMTALTLSALVDAQPSATNQTQSQPHTPSQLLTDVRLDALAQIETGVRDNPPGPDVSRYGISRPVWMTYTSLPFSAATNQFTAKAVASRILGDRLSHFAATHGRPATDAETYILWHKPATIDHPSRKTAEIAARFANLCQL